MEKKDTHGSSDKWAESLQSVFDLALENQGPERTAQLLNKLADRLHASQDGLPRGFNTPYVNTIPPEQQPPFPGDWQMERRIKSYIRWNAMAMVVKANSTTNVGGHISTYASAATLYEVGFNHFFRGRTENFPGDMVYFQGHAAPGIYARAFLEGRLDEKHLQNFRQELADGGGLSSYPHPYLMPEFWQFPTVSMGLGPILSIYQARFNRYLQARGLAKWTEEPKVWCFVGDGESDEPETLGSLTLASRENLDNLIWVVNCNLQRLDGPVRGNGKIIQELEAAFLGAGWNVIKLIWGSNWDELLARDKSGLLVKRMGEAVDGDYQKYSVEPGSYTRRHFFGKYPELLELVNHLTDEQIHKLLRGGHDTRKVHAAYQAAMEHKGRPTVILAKTVKGYGLGEAGEGRNISHQQKKMNEKELREFRARFNIPISDDIIAETPFYRPPADSPEAKYLLERRKTLGGFLPARTGQSRFAGARRAQARFLRRIFQRLEHGSFDDDGFRAADQRFAAAQGFEPKHRAHHSRRGAHVRPRRAVQGHRHLFVQGTALRSGGQPVVALLQRKEGRTDSRRRHHRGRFDGVVHCGGHVLRDPRRADGAVLHLLLDVRPAARGRLVLAGGRHPGERLSARRDVRPHHAQRRRTPASGRPQPAPCRHHSDVAGLRSGVCVRNRRHCGRRPAADVCRR